MIWNEFGETVKKLISKLFNLLDEIKTLYTFKHSLLREKYIVFFLAEHTEKANYFTKDFYFGNNNRVHIVIFRL